MYKIRLRLCEEAEQHTGSHSRTNHTGNIRTHGMHEQIVGGVIYETGVLSVNVLYVIIGMNYIVNHIHTEYTYSIHLYYQCCGTPS